MAFNSSGNEMVDNVGYPSIGYGGVGYGGGFGGSGVLILLVVVVLWCLFKDGHGHGGGYDHGYPGVGYGNGCGPCVQPTYKDESNWEQESHLKDKLCCVEKDIWKTDQDVWKTACETQKEVHCEGEKTRALIEQNYIQDLRDKIAEQNTKIQTMKNEAFTERKIDQVLGAINCTNQRIGMLECEVPKRPPFYACGGEPTIYDYPPRNYECNYPRRGKCDGYDYGVA